MSDATLVSTAAVPPTDTVLEVSRVDHWFGQGITRTQVLFDNKLKIQRGEIVIMLGPSGSGKTTLLTLIGALRTVQHDQEKQKVRPSLRVLGQELLGLKPNQMVEVRKRIGFIFQAHNLFSSLTATQNVELALELIETDAALRRRRATDILSTLGLTQRLSYRPEHLSGGLKQRVAIGRALANRPKLILADEPTAALDKKSAEVVVEELKKLAKDAPPEDRSTILVVTHDEKILGMADRIVTMKHGRIVSNVLKIELGRIITGLKSCKNVKFKDLSEDTLKWIASRMGWQVYGPGETIFNQGDEGDRFYLIWQGSVDIIIEKEGVKRRIVLRAGDVFGELALLSKDNRRTGSAIAREDVELYSMDKPTFDATLAESPSLNEEIRTLWDNAPEPDAIG